MRALFTILTLLIVAPSSAARVAPSRPPTKNPHTALTAPDKARVKAATLAIKTFLQGDVAQTWLRKGEGLAKAGRLPALVDKDLRCLKSPRCWLNDHAFAANVSAMRNFRGKLVEFRHPHVIPWSMKNFMKHKGMHHSHHQHRRDEVRGRAPMRRAMPAPALKHDEFMVHLYARFENTTWQHVDVIMTEGKDGKPAVRYFFATSMRRNLPLGVRC